MELDASAESNHHLIASTDSNRGTHSTELEERQATILSRIANLYGNLDDSASKCELVRPQQDPCREFLVSQHRIEDPVRKSGPDVAQLAELERRQATILSRVAGLYGNLGDASSKCDLVGNAGSGDLESRFSCRPSGAAACPGEASKDGDEHGETHSRDLGGKVLRNRNGLIRDCVVEGGQRQCGDGGREQDVDVDVEKRLSRILREAGADFAFKRVPADYYGRSFEARRDLLGAASVDHLCKSIVMVNTQAHETVVDCSDRNNSKYYVIVVQYTARLNAEKVRQFVYSLNDEKIPKKRFNLRLAPEEESNRLTGFEHNAVTPFGMRTNIPSETTEEMVYRPVCYVIRAGCHRRSPREFDPVKLASAVETRSGHSVGCNREAPTGIFLAGRGRGGSKTWSKNRGFCQDDRPFCGRLHLLNRSY